MDKQKKEAQSMRMLLQKEARDIRGSVYENSDILDWVLPENARLTVEPVKAAKDTFRKMQLFEESIRKRKSVKEYQMILKKLKLFDGERCENESQQKKSRLRLEKKRMAQMFSEQAAQEIFGVSDAGFQPYVVRSRDVLSAFELTELDRGGPSGEMWKRPWFTTNLGALKRITGQGGPVGMEGGSCLLGNNEMQFLLTTDDGGKYLFDFNTMRQVEDEFSLTETETSSQLSEFVKANKKRIVKASVKCHKKAITIDEYEEFTFLFSLARMFQAKLVITIPDMSYEKTFLQLFSNLKEDVFHPFYAEFMRKIYEVSDLNLRWINRLAKDYGNTDYVVLHKRGEKIHDCFSNKRDYYMQKDGLHKITNRDGMEAAIRDYICMPAMPYYLWGLENLIEVNRLEEYPSVEKCRRVHRGLFRLNTLLYPQKLCANGRTSGFYAARDFKEYVSE